MTSHYQILVAIFSERSATPLNAYEIIEQACKIHVDLQRRGLKIQEQDILIAATAITRGLILVSNDSDLLRVQRLNVDNWASIAV